MGGSRVGAVVVNRTSVAMPIRLPDMRTQLGCDIVGAIPLAVDALAMAQGAGSPLVSHQPQNLASTVLSELARKLASDQVAAVRME